jgi:hypothetical protein
MQLVAVPMPRLLDQASQCRRLAQGLADEAVRQKLLTLAAEYEAKVRAMTHAKQSQRSG